MADGSMRRDGVCRGIGTPLIWYRSADGCPDGPDFSNDSRRAGSMRLAVVGEPIDFIVTLERRGGSRGLLERQTKTEPSPSVDSTGACDEIADGLALSLSLARMPEERRREEPAPTAPATVETTALRRRRAYQAATSPSLRRCATRARTSIGFRERVSRRARSDAGVFLFVDVAPGGSGLFSRASVRPACSAIPAPLPRIPLTTALAAGGRLGACPAWFRRCAARPSVRIAGSRNDQTEAQAPAARHQERSGAPPFQAAARRSHCGIAHPGGAGRCPVPFTRYGSSPGRGKRCIGRQLSGSSAAWVHISPCHDRPDEVRT